MSISHPKSRSIRKGARPTVAFVAVYASLVALPLIIVLSNSFRSTAQIALSPIGLPDLTGAANFAEAWSRGDFSVYFLNSVWVTVLALTVGLALSVTAAYALGRFAFRGRSALLSFFLAGLFVPAQLGIVPIFRMFSDLGLVDSPTALAFIYASQLLPLSIFILAPFYRRLPDELAEAARIDGAGEFRVFRSIMFPLVRPAVATVAIIQIAPVWNDVFFPLVLLRTKDNLTLPVGLIAFIGERATDLGPLFAAIVIVSLPLVLLFAIAARQVISGLTAGTGK
ncbi:carbohydrate ABC transporter permease [Microbacterium sp. W4I20]|uniref:carbohydrate ABC transporter permease n=1 Tax=Microbacterium sp. W4I20 TaxID=3042262 RepID=UPI002788F33E|nr:carbohydrate ABC transporter permease [Microbacterium sp. W4I20]MDQ0726711.1 raffinose/stachyose/melibiose transport system permease protein [Microbacterium sp. W4I20]